jgi:subtilase family serine protease
MTGKRGISDGSSAKRLGLWAGVAVAALLGSPALATPLEAGAKVETAAVSTPVDFEVFLPLRNQAEMATLLKAQQARGSSQYHKWLTPVEFASRFGPTIAAMNSAKSAAQAAGLTVSESRSRSFHVTGDAGHANSFLHTSLKQVTSPDGRTRLIAADRPTLSADLQSIGAKVIAFSPVHARQPFAFKGPEVQPDNRATTVGSYWFDDLKEIYNYPAYKTTVGGQVAVSDGTGVSVAILMEDKLFYGDLQAAFVHELFRKNAHAPIPTATTVDIAGGGVIGGNGTFEASLDVQQVTGGAPGSKVSLLSIPDLSDAHIADGYLTIVESNEYDIVNSSFGGCELEYTAAYNHGVDFTDILMVDHEIFEQGNLEGITFVASSGDNGAVMCPTPNYAPGVNARFVIGVSSPAADPAVTAVGGGNLISTSNPPSLDTKYVAERAFGDPEVPYDIFGIGANVSGGYWAAGGGVSTIFAKPDYQTLVETGSSSGRTVPDVGMQVGGLGFSTKGASCQSPARKCAVNDSSVVTAYGVNYGGGFYRTIGTSVSSPEFVGALALYEQRAGRQGNLNPYLYAAGAAQTYAGGVHAPQDKQYFHRGQTGFDGAYPGGFPTANYDYIYGNGSPNVVNLFGLNAYGLAGTPQTPSNP